MNKVFSYLFFWKIILLALEFNVVEEISMLTQPQYFMWRWLISFYQIEALWHIRISKQWL